MVTEVNLNHMCNHQNCSKFKTKRQRMRHHNKHETECVKDKSYIIKMLVKFKSTIEKLVVDNNIDIKTFISSNAYKKLKLSFNTFVESNLINKALFFTKFGYECLDLMD